jgi:hypothetical protein
MCAQTWQVPCLALQTFLGPATIESNLRDPSLSGHGRRSAAYNGLQIWIIKACHGEVGPVFCVQWTWFSSKPWLPEFGRMKVGSGNTRPTKTAGLLQRYCERMADGPVSLFRLQPRGHGIMDCSPLSGRRLRSVESWLTKMNCNLAPRLAGSKNTAMSWWAKVCRCRRRWWLVGWTAIGDSAAVADLWIVDGIGAGRSPRASISNHSCWAINEGVARTEQSRAK